MDSTNSMAFSVKTMQVSEFARILSTYDQDAHIAIKWYDKGEFEMDLEEGISDLSWQAVCELFEQDENIDQMNVDFLQQQSWDYQNQGGCGDCNKKKCRCD